MELKSNKLQAKDLINVSDASDSNFISDDISLILLCLHWFTSLRSTFCFLLFRRMGFHEAAQ